MKRTYIKPVTRPVECFSAKCFLAGSGGPSQANVNTPDGEKPITDDEPDPDKPFGSSRWWDEDE